MPIGKPLANYAAYKRVGDTLYMSGVIAVDPAAQAVIEGYGQLPPEAEEALRSLGYVTGQMSVDIFEAPIVAQSWFVLNRIREMVEGCGGQPTLAVDTVMVSYALFIVLHKAPKITNLVIRGKELDLLDKQLKDSKLDKTPAGGDIEKRIANMRAMLEIPS